MRIFARPGRKTAIILLVLTVGLAGVVSQVEASDGMRGDRCEVAEDEYIVEDFYFICRVLEVRGTIDGDLLGIASEIIITDTARITGDLWIGGGKVTIAGTVGDDIHFAGLNLSISPEAQFTHDRVDITALALNTEIKEGAAIPGDLLMYGYQAKIRGTVGGDIDFDGEALIIEGRVEGRVDASVGDARRSNDLPGLPIYDVSFSDPGLLIGPAAYIGGDLAYSTGTRSEIPWGVVQGRIIYDQSLAQPDITKVEQADVAAEILVNYFNHSLRDVLTLMLIGLVALRFVPGFIRQPAAHVRRRTVSTIGWGLITFMLSFPVAVVLLVLSLLVVLILLLIKLTGLSLMIGVAMLVINAALIGGLAFLIFFMGRVVISYVIGQMIYRYVLKSPEPGTLRKWIFTLAMGSAVYSLITNVPVPAMGLIVELITALTGVGAIVIYLRDVIDRSNLFEPRPVLVESMSTGLLPPAEPPIPEVEKTLGLENLPEGFSGFDENW